MPIEIRELIIRSTIRSEEGTPEAAGQMSPEAVQELRDAILRECLQKVNQLLKQRKER
jgi:hypothetical protein